MFTFTFTHTTSNPTELGSFLESPLLSISRKCINT